MGAVTTIVNAKVFDGAKSRDWTSVRFADGLMTKCSVASARRDAARLADSATGLRAMPGCTGRAVAAVRDAAERDHLIDTYLAQVTP